MPFFGCYLGTQVQFCELEYCLGNGVFTLTSGSSVGLCGCVFWGRGFLSGVGRREYTVKVIFRKEMALSEKGKRIPGQDVRILWP